MTLIPAKRKYRITGRWPKTRPSNSTPNGGDAFLWKARTKRKMSADDPRKAPQQQRSMAGMKVLHIRDSKRHWESV